MALFDMPLEQLEAYRPNLVAPADFDQFWLRTIGESLVHSKPVEVKLHDAGLPAVQVFDLTFSGFGGQQVKAWFLLPAGMDLATEKLPCVVHYQGYGGGRGYPHEWLLWPSAGYAFLIMDSRGQGSNWSRGDTADQEAAGGNPQYPGYMTRGILDKEAYYYRRLFTDGVLAARMAAALPGVDPERIILSGGSQGGGITLAVSGILSILHQAGSSGDATLKQLALGFPRPTGCLVDVPFLCHIRRATEITDSFPYQEINGWCRQHREDTEKAFETLRYFDGVHFAARAPWRALFSVALMDNICPPSTVYAAYNAWAGSASIEVFPYNGHEGGGEAHTVTKLAFVRSLLGV